MASSSLLSSVGTLDEKSQSNSGAEFSIRVFALLEFHRGDEEAMRKKPLRRVI